VPHDRINITSVNLQSLFKEAPLIDYFNPLDIVGADDPPESFQRQATLPPSAPLTCGSLGVAVGCSTFPLRIAYPVNARGLLRKPHPPQQVLEAGIGAEGVANSNIKTRLILGVRSRSLWTDCRLILSKSFAKGTRRNGCDCQFKDGFPRNLSCIASHY